MFQKGVMRENQLKVDIRNLTLLLLTIGVKRKNYKVCRVLFAKMKGFVHFIKGDEDLLQSSLLVIKSCFLVMAFSVWRPQNGLFRLWSPISATWRPSKKRKFRIGLADDVREAIELQNQQKLTAKPVNKTFRPRSLL